MKVVDRLSQKILHLAPVPESNTSLPSDDDENYDCDSIGPTTVGPDKADADVGNKRSSKLLESIKMIAPSDDSNCAIVFYYC